MFIKLEELVTQYTLSLLGAAGGQSVTNLIYWHISIEFMLMSFMESASE
jgi:hypothetical protein